MPLLDIVQPAAAKVTVAETAPAAAEAEPDPAPAPAPSEEPVQTAALDPEPESAHRDLDEKYNVIGFNESSNDLTPRLTERLDQIIAAIGGQKCKVTVTGYSSYQGNHATNALFAIERAQNVLDYMRHNGLSYLQATAAGGGATDQFGPTPGANRRVVINVAP